MRTVPLLLVLVFQTPAILLAQASQPTASQPSSQPVSGNPELEALKAELERQRADGEKLKAELEALRKEADPDRVAEVESLVESLSAHVAGIDETIAQGGAPSAAPKETKDGGARLTGATFGGDWTWRVGKSTTSLGGYVSWKYVHALDDDPNTIPDFNLPRLVIFMHSTVSERISFLLELEIEEGGVNQNDTFRFRGEVVPEFAVMDFEFSDALSLRSGIVLVPFGKLNLVHDEPVQDLTERPLVDTFLIPSTWFEPGVGIFGQTMLTEDALLRYELYLIQGFTDRITSSGGLRGARAPMSFDTNLNKAVVGRAALEPYLGLEIGLAGYAGYYDPAGIRSIHMLGMDVTWRKGPFELVGEAVQVMLERGFNNVGDVVPTSMRGLVLEGHYHLYTDSLKVYNGLRNPHFTLIGRFDYADTDSSSPEENRLRLTAGLNFRPVEDFVGKIEYHRDLEGFAERVRDDLFVISTALSF